MREIAGLNEIGRLDYLDLAREKEAELHARFKKHRIRGEWFTLTDELATYIRQASNVPINTA